MSMTDRAHTGGRQRLSVIGRACGPMTTVVTPHPWMTTVVSGGSGPRGSMTTVVTQPVWTTTVVNGGPGPGVHDNGCHPTQVDDNDCHWWAGPAGVHDNGCHPTPVDDNGCQWWAGPAGSMTTFVNGRPGPHRWMTTVVIGKPPRWWADGNGCNRTPAKK